MLRQSVLHWQKKRIPQAFSFANFSASGSPTFQQGKAVYGWQSVISSSSNSSGSEASAASLPSSSGGAVGSANESVTGGSNPLSPSSSSASSSAANEVYRLVVVTSETRLDRLHMLGMPRGYPHTCAPGFPRYFYLSVGASFVGSFATSIATQTLLGGFFADSTARVWMIKDLIPAFVAAFIANKVVSYELRPKFWLVVYAVVTNVATVTDMFIPTLVPAEYLLAAAVTTTMMKQSAMLMFFVARAGALQHFATHNNLAEFTKKFNSFGMVNFTVATALGIAFTTVFPSFTAQITAVVICCALNTTLNYLSMVPIPFRVVNPTTGHIIMRHFVKSGFTSVPSPQAVSDILGIRSVVKHEEHEMTDVLCVSPPLHTLVDVLDHKLDTPLVMTHPSLPFAFGLWMVKQTRWQRTRSRLQRKARAVREWRRRNFTLSRSGSLCPPRSLTVFGDTGMKLVLLVGSSCEARHLLCAYLMAYSTLLEDHRSLEDVKSSLRDCSVNYKLWMQKSELLLLHLQNMGWDTKTLALDPRELRISWKGDDGVGWKKEQEEAPEDDEDD